VTSQGRGGPGRLQVWWIDSMDQCVEVARERNLISIPEKTKSFYIPLIQCGVNELRFEQFANLYCAHIMHRMSIVCLKGSGFIDA
jgi:hypothetical protein